MTKILTPDHDKYLTKSDLLAVSGWKEKTLWYWIGKTLNVTHKKQFLKGLPDRAFPWKWVVAWRDGEINDKSHPFTDEANSDHAWKRYTEGQVEFREDDDDEETVKDSGKEKEQTDGGEETSSNTLTTLSVESVRKFTQVLEEFNNFKPEEFKKELANLIEAKVQQRLSELPAPVSMEPRPWWKNFGMGVLTASIIIGGCGFVGVKYLSDAYDTAKADQFSAHQTQHSALKEQRDDALKQRDTMIKLNQSQDEKYEALEEQVKQLNTKIKALPEEINTRPSRLPWYILDINE